MSPWAWNLLIASAAASAIKEAWHMYRTRSAARPSESKSRAENAP
jgi:hypothetical protein